MWTPFNDCMIYMDFTYIIALQHETRYVLMILLTEAVGHEEKLGFNAQAMFFHTRYVILQN